MDFARRAGREGADYATPHHWSVTDPEGHGGEVDDLLDRGTLEKAHDPPDGS
ncbi:hypothetical protein [Streptomyces sp. WELS2]|uniref:hypothetical protein n=1 Tax=Streptomyces sp. WELS2 TaxID=2749435 RepID=UPI0015F0BD38|nr:hypothetical protein [Streptomyces sp. WELS2]